MAPSMVTHFLYKCIHFTSKHPIKHKFSLFSLQTWDCEQKLLNCKNKFSNLMVVWEYHVKNNTILNNCKAYFIA